MGSLTGCLKKAGDLLDAGDRKAIHARAAALRKEGLGAKAAAIQAVDELIAQVEGELGAQPEPKAAPVQAAASTGEQDERQEVLPAEAAEAVEEPAATGDPLRDDPASWVIREKATGTVIMETFDKKKVAALNTERYEAVPIHEYLVGANRAAREQGQAKEPGLKERVERTRKKKEQVAAPPAAEPPKTITDAGEKIGGARKGGGVNAATLRPKIDAISKAWKNGPKGGVHIVQSLDDLPVGLRRALKASDPEGQTRGLFSPGDERVYLIAQNLSSLEEAEFVLAHEVLGHQGLRAVLGDDYGPALMRLRAANPSLASEASMWFAQYGRAEVDARVQSGMDRTEAEREVRLLSTEEALADRAGQNKPLKAWDRFVATLQAALRRIGLNKVADWLEQHTEAETLALLDRARRAVEFGDTEPAVHRLTDRPATSRPVADWITTPDLESAAGKIDTFAPRKPIKDKLREMSAGWKDKIVQGMFDAYAPLKKLDMDAYIAARMTKSADGAFEGMLLYGKPKMDADGGLTGELDGHGFLGHMQELQGEHDRFFMWLAGNRAARLKAEGRENLFSEREIAAMVNLNRGQMKDGAPREAAYLKAMKAFASYNKSVLDIAEKTGLIDGGSRQFWEHEFYVPFYRIAQEGEINGPSKIKGLVRQKAFERLKGGKEPLGDLMENALRNWSHLLSASLANQAAAKALTAAEQAGVALEAKESDAKEMAKSIGKKGGAVYFMDQGVQRWFLVDDPAVLEAISAMEAVGLSGLPMKLMGKAKHWLTLGATISPAFKIRNLIRDTLAAPAANEMSYNVLANVMHGWKGTKKGQDQYARMLFGGAMMRFGAYLEGDRAAHVKRLIKAGIKDGTILDTREKVQAAAQKLWDSWQEFGDRMENVNRAALYEQLIAKGMSPREAAFHARDMMDFSLQGSWAAMRILTQVVPFLNARAQGLYKLGRAAAQDPKRLGYVTGAVALASIALLLAYEDDEDWKQREDWDRDSYWWFKIGGVAYRIPKPFEVGALGTIAERTVELVISDEMNGKRYAERLRDMVMDTFAMNPIPQLFKPMVDLYANKDSFTGRAIETPAMERFSKSDRYGPNTSALARALGAPGDYTNLSPVQVDHLLRGYFGWLGGAIANTVDVMAAPLEGNERPSMKLDDFTLGFAKELPAAQSRYVEEFYRSAREISQLMAEIKRARELGEIGEAAELAQANRDKVAQAKLYSRAERQMGKISAEIRKVRMTPKLSAEEKRAQIDRLTAQRNELARRITRPGSAAGRPAAPLPAAAQ